MYRRMLVPLDGSEVAEVVFPYARKWPAALELKSYYCTSLTQD
jgi:hypothetical protein